MRDGSIIANVPGIEMGTYRRRLLQLGHAPAACSTNSPEMLCDLGTLYQEKGIKPEFEVFDAGYAGGHAGAYRKEGLREGASVTSSSAWGLLGGLAATRHGLAAAAGLRWS